MSNPDNSELESVFAGLFLAKDQAGAVLTKLSEAEDMDFGYTDIVEALARRCHQIMSGQ